MRKNLRKNLNKKVTNPSRRPMSVPMEEEFEEIRKMNKEALKILEKREILNRIIKSWIRILK